MDAREQEFQSLKARVRELESADALWRKAEQTLAASEKKYRTIFENTGTATILMEKDTIISMVNTEFEKISGYTREEIEGIKSWADMVSDEDRVRMMTYHRKRRQDPASAPRNYECRLRIKNGEFKTCSMTVAMIPGTSTSVASIIDITESRKSQEALRISEEKFSKAFQSSPEAVIITTIDQGRFIDINDTFQKMTGFLRADTIGRTVDQLNLWPDTAYRHQLIALLRARGRLHQNEIAFRTKTGEMRTGMMSAETIELQGQECMLSAIVDITRQRRLEKKILKLSEIERQKIGQDLHDDLAPHLVGVEALSALLSQRLKQQEHPEAPLADEIRDLIADAIAKTRSLARGLWPVALDERGLAAALAGHVKSVEKLFGISCTLTYDKAVGIRDNIVATHLFHIARESVNNAIRHGKADRIRVELAPQKPSIVRLAITDNGRGIPEPARRKRGLGLEIMQYRAKMIGAHLETKRLSQGGTCIECTIDQKYIS